MTDKEIKLIKLLKKMNKMMKYYIKHPTKKINTTTKRISEITCLIVEFNNVRSQPRKPYASGGIVANVNYEEVLK